MEFSCESSLSDDSNRSLLDLSVLDTPSSEDDGNTKETMHTKRNKYPIRKRRQKQHSLDHLRHRVREILELFETKGIFVPLPENETEKGKVWSNRNYGQDKKRQRKKSERLFLERRIIQLEK
eukprot:CAMPEP_0194387494 /NCGR_PEP_ID=MMETSP0174-20130528/92719_1 /TAXON_ID=216777 /ORGANISM="Proboscia alata, Strain PI-D3" /LENGTH=121 /DNA_ID=CAMNT_0039177745 /DNA_START=70 /DNA_END=432 /DNA_ORIENTATION=+